MTLVSNSKGKRLEKKQVNQTVTRFKCNMCDIFFESNDEFNLKDYQELSVKMKTHTQTHDYHNDYVTERRERQ